MRLQRPDRPQRAATSSQLELPAAPRPVTRSALLRAAVLGLLVLAAPTAGDIGSCGQSIEDLDPAKFFAEKRSTDCQHCQDCALGTKFCEQACAGQGETAFPAGCYPLVHDGEVCLRALRAAGCDEYVAYASDDAPSVPTECNFCPASDKPGGS